MLLKKRCFILLFVLTCKLIGFSQDQELRTIYVQNIKLDNGWSISLDGGYYKGIKDLDHDRFGIRNVTAYNINNRISIDLGFMFNWIDTHNIGVKKEYRPHQSLTIAYPNNKKLKIKHRLRLDEQFFTFNYDEKSNSSSRLRYRLQTKRNFNFSKTKDTSNSYWVAFGEVFLNIAGKIKDDYNLLKRGRYGIGLGYKLTSNTSLEGNLFYQQTYNNTNLNDFKNMTIFNFNVKNTLFQKKQ